MTKVSRDQDFSEMFYQRADISDLASAEWPHPTPARLLLIVGFAAGS
jgi:hypothetical protein